MAWFSLIVAGLLEVVWAYGMKRSVGFTKLGPSVVTVVAMLASFGLLARAMKTIPLGTAYAMWTGIGALGALLVGVFVLGEQANAGRVVAGVLIMAGLLMMKLSSP